MKPKKLILLLSVIIFICSSAYIFILHLSKFQKFRLHKGNVGREVKRYLDNDDENDSYMVLYFKENVNYPWGFKNDYRKNINFIINRENNARLTSEEALTINKDFGIEIHYNIRIANLEQFFSAVFDENMEYIESIDLSKFNSSLVNNMESMFYGCISLKSINFSNFDTSSVTYMSYMFYGCISLISLNLSSFDISSLNDMDCLFYGCDSLISLDISNFDMANCYSYYKVFPENNNIKYLNVYNFKNDKIIFDNFNDKEDIIVYQKDKIITNPNIYNCSMNFV